MNTHQTTIDQQFHRGDIVHIAKNLGPSMAHFDSDKDAIVIGSYADQYGGHCDTPEYTLMFLEDGNECSWYYESQLTLIRHGCEDDITALKLKRAKLKKEQSDIEWIVVNWNTIRESTPGPSACALMRLIGITNPWPHGEGWEYMMNWRKTFVVLDPVLSSGDINDLRRFCELNHLEVP